MKSFKFIDYGCSHKLHSNNTQELYDIPICGTEEYSTPEML